MTVYVESNFVLEHSLQQEEWDSCLDILEMASQGRITLAVPAFSLAEPHIAISAKEKPRSRLADELRAQLREISRSKTHQTVSAAFEGLLTVLTARTKFERDGLDATILTLLNLANVIPLEAAVLQRAARLEMEFGLSRQDAIVLASVFAHLDSHRPSESCFLNRNAKDLDDPGIVEELSNRGCKLLMSFPRGHQYILSRLSPSIPEPS